MLGSHGFPRTSLCDVQIFQANSSAAGNGWARWARRPGCTKIAIFVAAGGGGGGHGVVGAASTAGGGGGGGSSGATYVECMAFMLPEVLFVSVGHGGAALGNGIASRVTVFPDTANINAIALANGGSGGGSGSGGTGGTAGTAGSVATIGTMPLAGGGAYLIYSGHAGTTGGAASAGIGLAYPSTGQRVMGGSGGGGLPAGGVAGSVGGSVTGAGVLDSIPAALGGSSATTPPENGSSGYAVFQPYGLWSGGLGGGSSHGSATGAGLVGGNGGTGGIGSGGGGGGGALTGSTQGLGGKGGGGLVIIVSW